MCAPRVAEQRAFARTKLASVGGDFLLSGRAVSHGCHLAITRDPYSRTVPYELPERAEQFGVRQLLHRALSCAKLPPATAMIGPATRAAIAAVAEHHPDATVEHIVAVYDAHALEQRELPIAERHAALGDPRAPAHSISQQPTR